jgi:hypothetical protein
MNSKYTRISMVSALAMLLAVLMVPGAAHATEKSQLNAGLALAKRVAVAPSPASAYAKLSASERALFDATTTPVTESVETTTVPASSITLAAVGGCWSTYQTWKSVGALGNVIYTWWQGFQWCGSGGSVTTHSVYVRGGETATPGWSYDGHGGSGGRNMGWEYRQYTQEKFSFFKFATQQTKCAQIRGGATGLFSARGNCDLS